MVTTAKDRPTDLRRSQLFTNKGSFLLKMAQISIPPAHWVGNADFMIVVIRFLIGWPKGEILRAFCQGLGTVEEMYNFFSYLTKCYRNEMIIFCYYEKVAWAALEIFYTNRLPLARELSVHGPEINWLQESSRHTGERRKQNKLIRINRLTLQCTAVWRCTHWGILLL